MTRFELAGVHDMRTLSTADPGRLHEKLGGSVASKLVISLSRARASYTHTAHFHCFARATAWDRKPV